MNVSISQNRTHHIHVCLREKFLRTYTRQHRRGTALCTVMLGYVLSTSFSDEANRCILFHDISTSVGVTDLSHFQRVVTEAKEKFVNRRCSLYDRIRFLVFWQTAWEVQSRFFPSIPSQTSDTVCVPPPNLSSVWHRPFSSLIKISRRSFSFEVSHFAPSHMGIPGIPWR